MREKPLAVSYVYDDKFRIQANQRGENYWYAYIQEIWEQLGLRPKRIHSMALLENREFLMDISTLVLGDTLESSPTEEIRSNLTAWVAEGGTLIGFAAEGLDPLFGNTYLSNTKQPDPYKISATFKLEPDRITDGVHSSLHPEQRLLIFSPIRRVRPESSTELARLYEANGDDSNLPAITKRSLGKGDAYYFSFNAAQTIWVLHQGRPAVEDVDGDGYLRTMDLVVIGDNNPEVLYSDEILLILQNIIGQKPHPFLYQLPPAEGKVPDAVFHWGGDDHSRPDLDLAASDWMRSKGLPYHINVMPSQDLSFKVQPSDVDHILRNGHEVSLHYNFVNGYSHPYLIKKEDVLRQAEAFKKEFGMLPVCSVNHWVIWTGWADLAEMMMVAGGRADNSFFGRQYPPMDPHNTLSFPGGTGCPFYFYRDHSGKNERIDFLEEPVMAYEPGHPHDGSVDHEMIRKVVDTAARYHLVMNLFFHPQYIGNPSRENTRAAISEILRYITVCRITAHHMGPDEVWRWWDSRSQSTIDSVTYTEKTLRFSVSTEYPRGVIVKVPVGSFATISAACDDRKAKFEIKQEFGQKWIYIFSPVGEHSIEVSWS